jgi:hypothetical protein
VPTISGGVLVAGMGRSVAENGGGGHDVYHNKRTYPQSGRFGGIVMLLMINDLKFSPGRTQKSRGIKFSGRSHDVIENKGKSKRQFGWSHDVDENKQLNFLGHDVYEKTRT